MWCSAEKWRLILRFFFQGLVWKRPASKRVFALWSQILREAAPVIQRPRAGGACVCELWPRAPHWAFTSPALLLRSPWSRWTPSARVILLNSMWCYWCWITAEPPTNTDTHQMFWGQAIKNSLNTIIYYWTPCTIHTTKLHIKIGYLNYSSQK